MHKLRVIVASFIATFAIFAPACSRGPVAYQPQYMGEELGTAIGLTLQQRWSRFVPRACVN